MRVVAIHRATSRLYTPTLTPERPVFGDRKRSVVRQVDPYVASLGLQNFDDTTIDLIDVADRSDYYHPVAERYIGDATVAPQCDDHTDQTCIMEPVGLLEANLHMVTDRVDHLLDGVKTPPNAGGFVELELDLLELLLDVTHVAALVENHNYAFHVWTHAVDATAVLLDGIRHLDWVDAEPEDVGLYHLSPRSDLIVNSHFPSWGLGSAGYPAYTPKIILRFISYTPKMNY